MKRSILFAGIAVLCASSMLGASEALAVESPDPSVSPGELCSANDSNFSGYDYAEHIARCKRNVTEKMKEEIAAEYGGIPKSEWKNYECDHIIPLCAGGSSNLPNLWPQPIDEAHQKDKIEDEVCRGMSAGTLTQAQAVQEIDDWFKSN